MTPAERGSCGRIGLYAGRPILSTKQDGDRGKRRYTRQQRQLRSDLATSKEKMEGRTLIGASLHLSRYPYRYHWIAASAMSIICLS